MNDTIEISGMAVGAHFRGQDVKAFASTVGEGEPVVLEAEPENQYDPNATKVFVSDVHVGYINRETAEEIASAIVRGYEIVHAVSISAADAQGRFAVGITLQLTNIRDEA